MIILAFFAFPLAVYCLVLGLINRRPHPVLVHGSWDCLGLLLGLSGTYLLAGPSILAAFFDREVRAFLLIGPEGGQVLLGELMASWWPIWLAYFLVVLAGAGFLVWWRAGVTVLYNIDPLVLDPLLEKLLDRLGREWTRLGNRVFIGYRDRKGGNSLPSRSPREAVLDVEPFYATRHVTLAWQSDEGGVRREVESELARHLLAVPSRDNPAAGWLLGIASVLLVLIIVGIGLVVFFQLSRG